MLEDALGRRPVLARERLLDGRVWDVEAQEFELGGARIRREVIVHPGAVAVLALDDEDRVVLVHQYRHPAGGTLWELPAGLLDMPGEDPLAAARRELAAHRTRRDEALRLWPDAPAAPVGYTRAPDAPDSGVLLAIRLESDCCEGWRAQIAVADTPERRQFCVDALAAAAMQLARWRTLVPGAPIEPLPGFPVTP